MPEQKSQGLVVLELRALVHHYINGHRIDPYHPMLKLLMFGAQALYWMRHPAHKGLNLVPLQIFLIAPTLGYEA